MMRFLNTWWTEKFWFIAKVGFRWRIKYRVLWLLFWVHKSLINDTRNNLNRMFFLKYWHTKLLSYLRFCRWFYGCSFLRNLDLKFWRNLFFIEFIIFFERSCSSRSLVTQVCWFLYNDRTFFQRIVKC